jgi:hypothetical protein
VKAIGTNFGNCNGDALMFKDMPAGTYQLQVVNYTGSNEGHPTLFSMKTHGEKGAVTLGQQEPNTYTWSPPK